MFKKTAVLAVALCFVFLVGGCATGGKQTDFKMQGLKNQVSALEAQVRAKDEEIDNLKVSLDKMQKGRTTACRKEVKSRPSARHIQVCLKNAGYKPGCIDGKMGKQTRQAIRLFQRDNGLNADGRVGKETWELLKKYLEQKVK